MAEWQRQAPAVLLAGAGPAAAGPMPSAEWKETQQRRPPRHATDGRAAISAATPSGRRRFNGPSASDPAPPFDELQEGEGLVLHQTDHGALHLPCLSWGAGHDKPKWPQAATIGAIRNPGSRLPANQLAPGTGVRAAGAQRRHRQDLPPWAHLVLRLVAERGLPLRETAGGHRFTEGGAPRCSRKDRAAPEQALNRGLEPACGEPAPPADDGAYCGEWL